jgi:hypothetical protein
MFGIQFQGAALTGIIEQPRHMSLRGRPAYRFTFGGIVWAMFVSSQDDPVSLRPCTLRPNGEAVLQVRDALEMHHLFSFGQELNRMRRNVSTKKHNAH